MIPIITVEIATNIAAHAQQAWTHGVPNDDAAEIIIANGLKPFYPNTERFGGSLTIVDVKVDDIALDVKAQDKMSVRTKMPSEKQKASAPNQDYFEIVIDDKEKKSIIVGRPKSILCPVRRPKVDLENFKGDPNKIITNQLQEYKDYAIRTTTEAGCKELRSVLMIYGKKHGYKILYIEEQLFNAPTPTHFDKTVAGITLKKGRKNKPQAVISNSYNAYDKIGQLYELKDYSKGSSNFNKRFDCNNGFLFVWPEGAVDTKITSIQDWQNKGNRSLVIS